ncbi:tyrosine-type recombinase/integrase [Moorella sp. Hama-1]|uniref:tyrosine-type recombinase/integrase n=1 Tax=Moorella sp. Hama-1 TaxID=2138101 RepID=UPI000D642A14|nr:tyrosine-type recombinase/integrase [Moorella sp. Hama-1]BCV20631.1 hypothetical protein hamaS1_07000 [Moorella sp. Hama-1]
MYFACKVAPATRQRRFNFLRSFFRFCLAEELIETNPMKHIEPPKVAKNTLPVYMDDAEMRTVLQRVKNARHYFAKRDRALILTLLLAGLRRSEIIRLNWEDVDLKNNLLLIKYGKGDKDRTVAIHPELKEALWDYLQSRPNLREMVDQGPLDIFTTYRQKNPLLVKTL